ncbi:DNA adenine methylase [Faecalispora jeddahensis]|uniref:DNA adenine methylase n=1 Tax=Faecalispora jeddahensis TaxID=1414721 RepID=UPI00145B460D|nr:DNA adenine methylase [Faecalispora jeddahensis]
MKTKPVLSIAPYYGGKARMAHFICDRINYSDTDIFVTPFGGMCRVLLNKARHQIDCYNDYNPGLYALITILSNRDTAYELIHRLYTETNYSKEEFDKQKSVYDMATKSFEVQEKNTLKKLLISHDIVEPIHANRLLSSIYQEATKEDKDADKDETDRELDIRKKSKSKEQPPKEKSSVIRDAEKKLKAVIKEDNAFKGQFERILANWILAAEMKMQDESVALDKLDGSYESRELDWPQNAGVDVSDMDLAVATYYVFQCSRDGMGQAFSEHKFKTTEQYLQRVMNLYDCAEQLEGVRTFQIDAMAFCRWLPLIDVDGTEVFNQLPVEFQQFNDWLFNSRVMMLCDPSYISPTEEKKLLKGIDVDDIKVDENSISSKIKERNKNEGQTGQPKNLGGPYAASFTYEDHERFLRYIQKAKCKLMVCNYDLQLYNKYLTPSEGWRREEFFTTTSVGGKADNSRVEVIWYNY